MLIANISVAAHRAVVIVKWLRMLAEVGQGMLHIVCTECAGLKSLSKRDPPTLTVHSAIEGEHTRMHARTRTHPYT